MIKDAGMLDHQQDSVGSTMFETPATIAVGRLRQMTGTDAAISSSHDNDNFEPLDQILFERAVARELCGDTDF